MGHPCLNGAPTCGAGDTGKLTGAKAVWSRGPGCGILSREAAVFELTIWTYLLLWAYVGATWWVAARRRSDGYRGAGLSVVGLLVLGTVWLGWALIVPRHHAHALGDYTYESVGCLLACLTGLYGLALSMRSFSLARLMTVAGGGWLLTLFADLIGRR